jgi:bifunctional DNA-binding transcriptional regulator/antitoxin component of YhaV-PrlF toxin-antitoxin module
MIGKLTSKNQITIPAAVLEGLSTQYFEIEQKNGSIILTPIFPGAADEVREKLQTLNISEEDVADAVKWARKE